MIPQAYRGVAVAAMAIAAIAGSASAGISGSLVHIEATSSLGTASLDFVTNSDFSDGVLTDGITESVELIDDDGDVIATITNLNVLLIADPVVNMNFAVFAGAADTSFTLTSTLLSFGGITNPLARASGSISVTDSNGNGATATGNYAGNKAFRAFYNGAVAGAGNIFSTLIDTPVVIGDPFGSDKSSEESGPGFDVIVDTVTTMSTEFQFTLSARDQVGGTSTFVVVPSPASMVLCSIGGLAMIRRKR